VCVCVPVCVRACVCVSLCVRAPAGSGYALDSTMLWHEYIAFLKDVPRTDGGTKIYQVWATARVPAAAGTRGKRGRGARARVRGRICRKRSSYARCALRTSAPCQRRWTALMISGASTLVRSGAACTPCAFMCDVPRARASAMEQSNSTPELAKSLIAQFQPKYEAARKVLL
jgi:hypothetical protein